MTDYATRRDTAVAATEAVDPCTGCGRPSTSTVVTFNGWVTDLCLRCARPLIDHIHAPAAPPHWTSGTYRRPGSDPVSTVDAAWSAPDIAEAAQRLLDDSCADLTPWQRDVLRAAYTPGPDGLPRYRRMYVTPGRRHGLVTLFRRLTRRTQ